DRARVTPRLLGAFGVRRDRSVTRRAVRLGKMAKRWRGGVGQARRGVFGELERRSCRLALDAGLTQAVEDLLPCAGDRACGIRIVTTPAPPPSLREHDRPGHAHGTRESARDE